MKKRTTQSFAWSFDFPSVCAHTSVSFLTHCPGYEEARRGDMEAALITAKVCAKAERMTALKEKYPDAVLLPIISNNRLPEAFAQVIGMKTNTKTYQSKSQNRKTMTAEERLIHKPSFGGEIEKGARYIVIEEIVTQGSTIAAMRNFVMACGGTVIAAEALAVSAGSSQLAPSPRDILELTEKFGIEPIAYILKKYKIANCLHELTHRQIRYILSFNCLYELTDKLDHACYGPRYGCRPIRHDMLCRKTS